MYQGRPGCRLGGHPRPGGLGGHHRVHHYQLGLPGGVHPLGAPVGRIGLAAGRPVDRALSLDGNRCVVLPQGLRYVIPGWSNELVYPNKFSSLAAFITVPELFFRGNPIASETVKYTAMFTLVALVYLALEISASTVVEVIEARVAIPGIGQTSTR